MYTVSRENSPAGQQPPALPIRETKFGSIQCILSVYPTRESVAHKWRIAFAPYEVVVSLVLRKTRNNELRAMGIERCNAVMQTGLK